MSDSISPEQAAAHWAKTRRLMWTCLIIWAIFSFFIHMFVGALNGVSFLGFPLGYYVAAQGALIVFVVEIAVYARLMNKKDLEYGIVEEGGKR